MGHAICEGYISNINEKLTGWKLVENTLFEDQVLIDLLNMAAGDQKYVGQRIEPQEGEEDIFMLNNRTGKKYKINLTEV